MIAIIDYGMGNLHSVLKAIERLGYQAIATDDAEKILGAKGVILPGVGAFGDAMINLREKNLIPIINEIVAKGTPFLGICLGMQLLFEKSEEHGQHLGLGILKGEIKRFNGSFKIPHMGWNQLTFHRPHLLLKEVHNGYVYFVHSYYAEIKEENILLASTDYYQEVPAIVGKGNVLGMQFHPEKSGKVGMKLLNEFVQNCEVKQNDLERISRT